MAKRSTRKLQTIGLLSDPDAPLKSRPAAKRDKDQPRLPFDPMPQRIEPALALLAKKPPTGDQWAYEVKWDGYRLAVHVESTGVRIITRGGHDWTSFFPAIATAAKALGPATMILDGEAVVLDDNGLPNFGLLQQALGGRRATRAAGAALFYAFDLLYFDGHNLTGLELSSRRHMLTTLLNDRPGDAIRLSETIEADGESLLRNACAHGLEGIIAKDINSPYRSGRRGDWLKIKCSNSESFAVIGYEPSQKVQGSIASLLLAAKKGDQLVYVGNVGTGFSAKLARDLRRQLDTMRIEKPSVPIKGKGLVFVRPTLIAEVNFSAWTHDGNLRHPAFKGIREVADHAEVYQLV